MENDKGVNTKEKMIDIALSNLTLVKEGRHGS